MKKTKAAAILRRIAIFCTALLVAFRVVVLQTAFDKDGPLPRGSIALPVTVLLCAVCFVVLLVFALKLNGLPGRESYFSVQGIWLPLKLLAAAVLLAGSVMTLLEQEQLSVKNANALISVAGIVSAVLMGWNSLQERRNRVFFWARLFPAVFAGAALVLRFRIWSHDPMVIHVVPSLLAWTCCMVQMMLLSGFPLDVGHRRSAALFGLSTGMYTCMTVPDYILSARIALPDLLTLLGLALWCVVAALELLRRRTQRNMKFTGEI